MKRALCPVKKSYLFSTCNTMSLEPQHIIYPKSKKTKTSHQGYDAIAVCEINLNKNDPRNNEKCAFSQFLLSECASISALIYSKNVHNTLGNNWQFLCDEDFTKIHLFDTDYLKKWIEIKGCEYIHCPLCKTGITEEKERIEEHDIDSMSQLKERRAEAKKNNDLYMIFHIEHLILEKASTERWNLTENQNKMTFNQDMLREVLNHWKKKNKIDAFRERIVAATKRCIENDNVHILRIMLKHCDYAKLNHTNIMRNNETIEFINTAAKHASFDCISLLLNNTLDKLDWSTQKRPIVLLNAVQYHPENVEMIKYIMDKLEALKIGFVCDDVFEQVIKFDLVEIARRIVNNRWHKINQKDECLAKQINLNCNLYFKERAKAFNLNFDENQINYDDDEWNEDDADNNDDFDDDDDWQNADD
eukprot:244853_1